MGGSFGMDLEGEELVVYSTAFSRIRSSSLVAGEFRAENIGYDFLILTSSL